MEEERRAAEDEVDTSSKAGSQKRSPKASERDLMGQTHGAASSKAVLTERQKMDHTAQNTENNRPASDFGMLSS